MASRSIWIWSCGCPRDLLGLHVLRARDRRDDALDLVRRRHELVQVVAEELDRELRLHAAQQLVDAVRDRLREVERDARDLGELLLHRLDQLGLVAPGLPLLLRLERDDRLDVVDRLRVATRLGATDLRDHVRDLGKRLRDALELRARCGCASSSPADGASVTR